MEGHCRFSYFRELGAFVGRSEGACGTWRAFRGISDHEGPSSVCITTAETVPTSYLGRGGWVATSRRAVPTKTSRHAPSHQRFTRLGVAQRALPTNLLSNTAIPHEQHRGFLNAYESDEARRPWELAHFVRLARSRTSSDLRSCFGRGLAAAHPESSSRAGSRSIPGMAR